VSLDPGEGKGILPGLLFLSALLLDFGQVADPADFFRLYISEAIPGDVPHKGKEASNHSRVGGRETVTGTRNSANGLLVTFPVMPPYIGKYL
jgi:hypothetical protein